MDNTAECGVDNAEAPVVDVQEIETLGRETPHLLFHSSRQNL